MPQAQTPKAPWISMLSAAGLVGWGLGPVINYSCALGFMDVSMACLAIGSLTLNPIGSSETQHPPTPSYC